MNQTIDFQYITDKLIEQLVPKASHWLTASIDLITHSKDLDNDLLNSSARARRLCSDTVFEVQKAGFKHWDTADWVRTCLLHAALQHPTHAEKQDKQADKSRAQCISNYYRFGDEHEKASALKALLILDPQGHNLQVALNACRANSLQLLEAITLHNDFPSAHFPELNWNQLVLKALFQGLNIASIRGLKCRQNAKLSEMVYSYAQEQILADRSPPTSIWLAMRLADLPENARHLFTDYRSHADTEHHNMIDLSIQIHGQTL